VKEISFVPSIETTATKMKFFSQNKSTKAFADHISPGARALAGRHDQVQQKLS
jgi:hypothetical protein